MAESKSSSVGLFIPQTVAMGLMVWWAMNTPWPIQGSDLDLVNAAIWGFSGLVFVEWLTNTLRALAWLSDFRLKFKSSGHKGTARWATYKDIKGELSPHPSGSFWGLAKDRRKTPLFIPFESNALTIGPSGSGKFIYKACNDILSILCSKVIVDFKEEYLPVLQQALRDRGETIRTLIPVSQWGFSTDCLNPLDTIVADLYRSGGLRDIPDDLRELSMQVYPEPKGSSDDFYWRQGGRDLMALGSVIECMIEEKDATFERVSALIEDKEDFEKHLRWIIGIDSEGKPRPDGPMPIDKTTWAEMHDEKDIEEFARWIRLRSKATLNLMGEAETRTYNSFASGIQQALAPLAYGNFSKAMGRSTCDPNEIKDGIATYFIVPDLNRPESSAKFIQLMDWTIQRAMKRHPDRQQEYFRYLDEVANYTLHNLAGEISWSRAIGARTQFITQNFSALEARYGKQVVDALLSECEIIQILPGQRAPETLEMVSKRLLGTQSAMMSNLSQSDPDNSLNTNQHEDGRALADASEIKEMKEGILLVRNKPPILTEMLSYAEIDPYRDLAGANPYHGNKPYKRKVKLRLKKQEKKS